MPLQIPPTQQPAEPNPKIKTKSKLNSRSYSNRQGLALPSSFTTKKSQILTAISVPQDAYTDKSPKGTIDAPIIDLINELNAIDGLVTTSSCSGRVAVFVEGSRGEVGGKGGNENGDGEREGEEDGEEDSNGDADSNTEVGERRGGNEKVVTSSPAGKGGGKWLFVSHDPVEIPVDVPPGFWEEMCGLTTTRMTTKTTTAAEGSGVRGFGTPLVSKGKSRLPRLVKLVFSPLILHVLAASLGHAKPLLAAAINAGFRESGVQSLKALDDPEAGVMVGIRTNGLGFETVVGVVREEDGGEQGEESYEAVVGEEYLGMMFGIVNERFAWNEKRKERFREEVRRAFSGRKGEDWEEKGVRARRLRELGLRRREELREMSVKRVDEVEAGEEVDSAMLLGRDSYEGAVVDMFDEESSP